MAATGYLLQAGEDPAPERHRLRLLERFRDPGSMRRLRALGVTAGWRCLEAGAGAGSIAGWLGRLVGPSGWVVATDIDTRHLDALRVANIEVRAADLLGPPWDLAGFDVVHARALLHHLPGHQDQAIARLVAALQPGGWLLLEEPHVLGAAELQPGPWGEALTAFARLSQADYIWAHALPSSIAAHGLVAVGAEAELDVFASASDLADFYRLSLQALSQPLLATGAAHPELLAAADAQLCEPGAWLAGMHWVAAWGRTAG